MRLELPDSFWFGEDFSDSTSPYLRSESKVIRFSQSGGLHVFDTDIMWAPCGDVIGEAFGCDPLPLDTIVKRPWWGGEWRFSRKGRGISGTVYAYSEGHGFELESIADSPIWQLNFLGEDGHDGYCNSYGTTPCTMQGRWVVDASTIPVPEPTPLLIGGVGLIGLWCVRRPKGK